MVPYPCYDRYRSFLSGPPIRLVDSKNEPDRQKTFFLLSVRTQQLQDKPAAQSHDGQHNNQKKSCARTYPGKTRKTQQSKWFFSFPEERAPFLTVSQGKIIAGHLVSGSACAQMGQHNNQKRAHCKFVTGSAAVVESLWSMYDAFNTKRRRGMSPITVEMILFLKKNKDLWGIEDVAKANQNRLNTERSERLQKKIAEHEEYMRDHED